MTPGDGAVTVARMSDKKKPSGDPGPISIRKQYEKVKAIFTGAKSA